MKVAVVGAGIVGLFAARALAREGVEVEVFDPAPPGARSVHAAGIIEPTRAYRTNTWEFVRRALHLTRNGTSSWRSVDPRWLLESLRQLGRPEHPGSAAALARLSGRSLAMYAELAEQRNDFEYRREGLLEVYRDPTLFAAERRGAEKLASSVPFEVREGTDGAGALFFPTVGWLHTERCVARLVADLAGVRFHRSAVDAIEPEGVVRVAGSATPFDRVVLATGVFARRLGIPLTAVRGFGWHLRSRAPPRCATIDTDTGVALAPFAGDLKATGGWLFDLGSGWSSAAPVLERVRRLVPVEEVVSADHGWRPCSPDGLPVVSRAGNYIVANGGFRLGWSFAPSLGEEAASLAVGTAENDRFLARFSGGLDGDRALRLAAPRRTGSQAPVGLTTSPR